MHSTLTRTTTTQINGIRESQVRQKRSYHVQYHVDNICTDLISVIVELVEFVCVDPSSSSLELDKTVKHIMKISNAVHVM